MAEAKTPWKESTNIKAYLEGKNIELRIKKVRISFAHLFKPQERKNDDGVVTGYNYSLNALIPKVQEDDVKLIQAAQVKAIELQWGTEKSAQPKIPAERRCLRDGEPKDPDTEERIPLYDGYEGMVFLSANRGVDTIDAPNPIQLLDSRKDATGKFPRLKSNSGKLYSGCVSDVVVRLYGYDGKGKNPNRVNASLEAVKFVKHGPAFGQKPIDADNAFDEEDDEEMEGNAPSDFSDDDDDLLG